MIKESEIQEIKRRLADGNRMLFKGHIEKLLQERVRLVELAECAEDLAKEIDREGPPVMKIALANKVHAALEEWRR